MPVGMYETYIQAIAARHFSARTEKLAAIRSREQAEARQREVRAVCAEIFGAFPERGPLKTKIVDRFERDGYAVEILTYESLPGMPVTANLYLPLSKPGPHPGVVVPIGHWPQGKAHEEHQRLGQLFARRGLATLIFDGVSQGERVQYFDVVLRRSWVGKSVTDEHTQLGNVLFYTGHHLGLFMMWDAMRGLDVLAERAGVDPQRLGCTGASGGGTLTRFLACMEPRLSAACCVADNCQPDSIGGGDAEQNLFGSVARGVTALDMLMAFAPKPLLLAYCSGDHAAQRSKDNLAEVGAWYELFNARPCVDAFLADGPHGYLKAIRTRAVEFFMQAFGLPADRAPEPTTPLEPAEALNATETGQVLTALNAVDLFAWHRERVQDFPPAIALPTDEKQARTLQETLRAKIRPHLRFSEPRAPVEALSEGHSSDWGLAVEKGRLVVEDGIYLPYAFYSAPEGADGRVARPTILELHERGVSAIAAQGPWMTQTAAGGCNILAVDVRARGETRVEPNRDDGDPYDALLLGSEAQWARKTLNVGRSLFGGRVFDALRALQYLRTRWDVKPDKISLVGIGRGALWALYAAALDEKVERAVLLRGLSTYKSLVDRRRASHHFSICLPGAVKDFDLPHVAACVAPRALTLVNPVNQRRERLPAQQAERDYALTREIYKRFGAAKNVRVVATDCARDTLAALAEGLGVRSPEAGAQDETFPE
ncbi:MAG: acetylxylan esterase [Planctomycetes bacterium]|nr:acetylxylan esterase [Planctomycetota bacterium]